MTATDRLLAIEEIKQLKARYFRCMDQKKWDEFEAVFLALARSTQALPSTLRRLAIPRS